MSISCSQPSLSKGELSSVMVIALGARGHGFAPRQSPTRDNWNNLSQQFHILRNIAFFEKLNETQDAPQIIKKLVNWSTMIINCWQPSSKDSGLEVRFSLWKQEVTGSINGCPKLGIIELIGPNNSISWVIFHLLRNYLENSLQTRLEKNINWSTTIIKFWQPSLLEGERSSVMVIPLGARGHGFTPRLYPTRDNWNNLSQQFHILRNVAFF